MEEQNNNKRVLSIELDDEVKRVSITGLGDDNKVVMAHELDEEELDQATGGRIVLWSCNTNTASCDCYIA